MKYKMDKRSIYYRKFDVGVWSKIVLCCVVWTYLIDLAYSECASSLPESQVAYMCINSEASGQTVYIDTTKGKATDNSSGPLCVCNATISNAKFVNVRVQEKIATCGSKLKFDFANKQVESNENSCRSTKELVQIVNQQEVTLSLEKIKTPYSVEFCTEIEIELCANPDDYQCNTSAECIAKTKECDNVPDCDDTDDEDPKKCRNAICSEALKPCKNGAQCFSDAERCDNVSKCDDGTDEEGCFLDQDVLATSTKAQRADPIISIQCYESTRFSTTNTTTKTQSKTQSTPKTATTAKHTTTTKTTTEKTPTTHSTSTVSSSSMEGDCKSETGVSVGAVAASVIGAIAVGILIGVICTLFISTRKRIKTGSKTQLTVSHEIELTEPPTAVQLQSTTKRPNSV